MLRFFLFFMIFLPVPALAAPKVVATIAPLAGIAAAVMDGAGVPDLLIKNNASPHTYQLKPSDAALLAGADIVVWVGEGMEVFLADKLPILAPEAKVVGMLEEGQGMNHLPVRQGANWEGEQEEKHDHDHEGDDPHAWLDPRNAAALAKRLAAALAEKDPVHASLYAGNAEKFERNTQHLDAEISALLKPVASKPFAVFHDAYQYFEKQYGLHALGAISLSPDVPPSPRRLAELQQQLQQQGAVCVFAEPQFSRRLVETLAEGGSLRVGVLNPDASDLAVTPDLYGEYLRRLAQSFSDCLRQPDSSKP